MLIYLIHIANNGLGSFFQHWRDNLFLIANLPQSRVFLRRFPGAADLKLSHQKYSIKKAQIIAQYTWHEMRLIYLGNFLSNYCERTSSFLPFFATSHFDYLYFDKFTFLIL